MSDLATLRIIVSADNAIRVVDQFGNAVERAATKTERLEQDAGEAKRALDALGNEAKDATRDLVRSSDDIARAAGAIVGAFGATAALVIVDFFGDLIAEQRRAREEMVRTADEWEKQIARMVNAGDVAELTKLAREAFLGTPADAFRDGVQAQQKLVDSMREALNADPIGRLGGVFGGNAALAEAEKELARRVARFEELRGRIFDTVNVPFLEYGRDAITTTADAPGRAARATAASIEESERAVRAVVEQYNRDAAAAFAFRMEREAAAQERLADIEAQRQAKALAGFKAQLDAAKHVDDTLTRKSLGALKGALADVKDGTDVLTESARVFTEQTQLALGRFASDFLKDGFRSLDRFWDDFLQLGRDAIGNVFAKSVMERFGDTLGDKLGGLLGGLGGTGAGILGAVGAGLAVGLDKLFGESKWERAAEEHQRAARAMQEAASELKMSTQASQARWLDDFLNYANDETPIARELRHLTNRRNDLAMQALGIARTATHGAGLSSPYAQSLIANNDWTAVAAEARHQAAQGNFFDDGRRALLDFADALDLLNAALADNREAALRATDAQQELTLAQFRDELGADATGQLSASQRLAEAQRQYDAILGLAQAGDASAVDSLPETARTLIDAARETFASGVRYQELFAGVQADVDALLAAVRARTALPYESIEPSPVGFADSIAAPDLSPVTDALAVQADRALAVANAQLAVQQEGFTAVVVELQSGFVAMRQELHGLRMAVFEIA